MKNISIKTRILFLVFLFCSENIVAQPTQKISLNGAIELTLANNLQIKQAAYIAGISDENLKQARYEHLPSLESAVSSTRQYGLFFDQQTGQLLNSTLDQLNGRLTASIPIFQGFSIINQVKQNKNFWLASKSNIEKIRNDLSLEVISIYLQILANKDLITASQQQLELSKNQLNIVQKRFEVGNNTKADLAQAKAQLSTNKLNVTQAQNAYDQAILNLKQLMEMDTEKSIEVVAPLVDEILFTVNHKCKDIFDKAIEISPDIKSAQYNTTAFKYGVNVAKGRLYPTFSFGGGITTGYTSNSPFLFNEQLTDKNLGKSLGFNLTVPLSTNYRIRSVYNISKIKYENAKNIEQLAKNNLNKVINQAVLNLRSAEKRYFATKSALDSSTEVFNVSRKRFEVGLLNSIELNLAQTNFNKAQFDWIQAKYDLLFRNKVIDFFLGNALTF